jgi:hypothetical protein
MPARACTFDRSVLEQAHGPEALTVEQPVETRQEEIRALLGPPPSTRGETGSAPCTTRRRLEVRLLPGRLMGREPDGDGTALITRDDVVRLHDALPSNDE